MLFTKIFPTNTRTPVVTKPKKDLEKEKQHRLAQSLAKEVGGKAQNHQIYLDNKAAAGLLDKLVKAKELERELLEALGRLSLRNLQLEAELTELEDTVQNLQK